MGPKDKPISRAPEKKGVFRFQDAVCAQELKVIQDDLSTLVGGKVSVSGCVGWGGSGQDLGALLGGDYLLTEARTDGAYKGKVYLLNHPDDIVRSAGMMLGVPPEEVQSRCQNGIGQEDMEAAQEITNVICGSMGRGWRAGTDMSISVTKTGSSLMNFDSPEGKAIFQSERKFILIQADTAVGSLGQGFILQVVPLRLAMALARAISNDPVTDLEQFAGMTLEAEREALLHSSILVVDDSPTIRRMLRIILERSGYKVMEASSGREALTQIARNQFNLIITDIMMDDVDGMGLCIRLKEKALTKNVPIIFCSMIGSEEKIRNAISIGGSDYILKPFSKEVVLSKVEKALQNLNDE